MRCGGAPLARTALRRVFDMLKRLSTLFVSVALAAPITLHASSGAAADCAQGVTRIDITRREPFAGGMPFGKTGPYEKMVGRAFIEVDPEDAHNSIIQDISSVPVNECGHVEFSTDIYILKPVDMAKGNRQIFFEVNNRGNKIGLGWLNDAPSSNDPSTEEDAGNGFLMRQGYAIVWAGWEADVLPGNNRLTIDLPVATESGEPITGRVGVQYDVSRHISREGAVSLALSGRPEFDPYPAASLDNSTAIFTERDLIDSPETAIPQNRWAFARCERDPATGAIVNVVPSAKHICYFDGFDPDKLYQLVYTAQDPKPMALGYAATRDVLSFLRYEVADATGAPNPLGTGIGHVQCIGISSSGMYVRDYLYLGFNEDPSGRRVCDGLTAYIPGGFRLHLNTRFTQPDIYSRQDLWAGLWPMATFPFTFGMTTDPVTGRTDAILKRPASDPLVMQVDTSTEFWQFHGSLVTHDGEGRPVALPPTARYYLISSAQHGSGTPPSRGISEQLSNPLNYGPFNRALLVALDRWVRQGTEPPPSQYPRVDDGTLVPPDQASTGFPSIPGVTYNGKMNLLPLRDYGPGFTSTGGVITLMPPVTVPGKEYTVLVPRVDADGLDVAGLRRPDDIETPLATHTGWNQRAAGFRHGDLSALSGMYVPFAETRAERLASGDPRLSIEERYRNHGDYVSQVRAAALALRAQGYLLQEDVRRIIDEAAHRDVP
jgi:hypothetical protein